MLRSSSNNGTGVPAKRPDILIPTHKDKSISLSSPLLLPSETSRQVAVHNRYLPTRLAQNHSRFIEPSMPAAATGTHQPEFRNGVARSGSVAYEQGRFEPGSRGKVLKASISNRSPPPLKALHLQPARGLPRELCNLPPSTRRALADNRPSPPLGVHRRPSRANARSLLALLAARPWLSKPPLPAPR